MGFESSKLNWTQKSITKFCHPHKYSSINSTMMWKILLNFWCDWPCLSIDSILVCFHPENWSNFQRFTTSFLMTWWKEALWEHEVFTWVIKEAWPIFSYPTFQPLSFLVILPGFFCNYCHTIRRNFHLLAGSDQTCSKRCNRYERHSGRIKFACGHDGARSPGGRGGSDGCKTSHSRWFHWYYKQYHSSAGTENRGKVSMAV